VTYGPGHNNYQMDGVFNYAVGQQSRARILFRVGISRPDGNQRVSDTSVAVRRELRPNPGANVNVDYEVGNHRVHGTAFEFLRNTDLNANSFFQNRQWRRQAATESKSIWGRAGRPDQKGQAVILVPIRGHAKMALIRQGNSTGATLRLFPPEIGIAGIHRALGQAFCDDPTFSKKIALAASMACDGSNQPCRLNILRLEEPERTYYIPGSGRPAPIRQQLHRPDILHARNRLGENALPSQSPEPR